VKAAIYARVSTLDQEPENQLAELRRYVEVRGWRAVEYVDRGVSGAKERRPALSRGELRRTVNCFREKGHQTAPCLAL
jgi:DNA invertase Pin-like site-specific DNA recombinase